jgi:hypothetical protein
MTATRRLQHPEANTGHEVGRTDRCLWRSEPDGKLSASRGGLLMVVQESAAEGFVRFLVFRQRAPGHRAPALIGSGTQTNMTAAKSAAETMAARAEAWA